VNLSLEDAQKQLDINLDRLAIVVSWLLPRRLAYWCAVRVASYATGEHVVEVSADLTCVEALRAWEKNL
jgi:hypothetical protein